MSGDLKTVLVDALAAQAEGSGYDVPYVYDRGDGFVTVDGRLEIDRLATAIRDHLFDDRAREVLAWLESGQLRITSYVPGVSSKDAKDRLIAGLAGGSEG